MDGAVAARPRLRDAQAAELILERLAQLAVEPFDLDLLNAFAMLGGFAMVAFIGPDNMPRKVSSASGSASPTTATVTRREVMPGANFSVLRAAW